jgi:hypothetical protein
LFIRNNLDSSCNDFARKVFQELPEYDPEKDIKVIDQFGPLRSSDCLRLPEEVEVSFICEESDLTKLNSLLDSPLVGVASAKKIQAKSEIKYKDNGPALLQLSSQKEVFLIDLHSLANNKELDKILSQIFTSCVIIGFAFQSHLKYSESFMPFMSFYKSIPLLVDLQ